MKRSKYLKLLSLFFVVLLSTVLLNACGNATRESGGADQTVATEQAAVVGMDVCTQCHRNIVDLWVMSRHGNTDTDASGNSLEDLNSIGSPNTTSASCSTCHDPLKDSANLVADVTGNMPRMVIGCEGCHGGGGQHFGIGPITLYNKTADATGSAQFNTCTTCHVLLDSAGTGTNPSPKHSDKPERIITDTHFDNPATAALEGYNISKMSETACTNCHNPHTASVAVNNQWVNSGHGDLTADPWSHYDWKAANRQSCQRCHTATGAANYLSSPSTYNAANNNFSHLSGSQLEVLYCNACHINASGGIRNPGAITADYDVVIGSTTYADVSYTYPNAYASNVCLACHTGRQSGDSIQKLNSSATLTVDFNNLSFVNSHYLTAGGTVYTATGYEFSGQTYTNPSYYKHDKIGTSSAPGTGSKGPCVGCHMSLNTGGEKHSFMPVSTDADGVITGINTDTCATCHTGGYALTPAILEEEKEGMESALLALRDKLDAKGFYFYEAHPYFYQKRTNTGTASITNGAAIVTGTGVDFLVSGATVTAGDFFRVNADGEFYKIKTVDSATQLTLVSNFTGTTASNAAYAIIKGGSAGAVKDWTAAADDQLGAIAGKNNMGAAFNYNLLEHDGGAFAHNRYYSKRLIYDSIDWLDDGVMNGSVNLTGYTHAITWYGSATPARP